MYLIQGFPVTFGTRCMTDLFTVSGGRYGTSPPDVCGLLTGQHMYVDAAETCNTLTMTVIAQN